jgi:hypothetical protein
MKLIVGGRFVDLRTVSANARTGGGHNRVRSKSRAVSLKLKQIWKQVDDVLDHPLLPRLRNFGHCYNLHHNCAD